MPTLSVKYILGGLLIYAELLVVGLRDYVCTHVIEKWGWLNTVAAGIVERPWLVVVTSVMMAIPYYYAIEHLLRDRKFSTLRFAIFAITALMFYSLTGVRVPGGFALTVALGSSFVGLCVLEVIKACWNESCSSPGALQDDGQYSVSGFSNITKDEDLYDLGWGGYAKCLYEKLVATNVEEAYAVGINAKWGYGKTTYLNNIKKNLSDKEILVEFNPWLSNSPDQIVKDFFEGLKDKLTEYDKRIDDDIDSYVTLLIDIDVHPMITAIAKAWEGASAKSIVDSRTNIQNHINQIGKKIFVLIDDLDRLEKEEIYEVLKLIRNTAKFKNLIYIVAYDRQYICSTLRQKDIVDPETYLYKIFQMEVLLPTFEGDLIEEMLIDELKKQLDGEVQQEFLNAIDREISKASHSDRAVGHFLKNFRDVKRFVNLLCFEIEQVASLNLRHDVLPWGLFWLEIIHYAHEDVYLKLRNNYAELLKENEFDGNLGLKDEKNEAGYDGHLFEVLKYMFGPSSDCRGINNINSYTTYFSLRPYVDQVGWSEFIYAINTKDDHLIEEKMKEWLDAPEGKIPSLYSRFKGIKIGKSARYSKAFEHYFNALVFWADYRNDSFCKYYLPKIFHHIVDKRNCNETMKSFVCDHFDKMVHHLLERRENCITLMKILTEVYPMDFGEEYLINDNVIGIEKIGEYVALTFNKFIEGCEINIEDLCNEKSEIHRLIKCAKIDFTEDFGGAPFFVFNTQLREYFKNKPKKDSAAVLMNTFKLDGDMIDRGYDENELRDDLVNRICKYFVSLIWYRNFLWQCVAEDRALVDKYMKDNLLD